ncbi:hypothetical protein SAMN05444266_108269 [Chitinophaga jiangningensis]|uniref:Surface glycan-binding protein B xyloglucan binding domain-containing protein n=2 Tax=Chitinophaga jiangningensis TaxID=1419482 RepID=A0A1M7JA99_9BACT|nr:hypothetical protein SAMN05444266_108269 [Chitinophaga jiangningensis]
MAGLFLLFICAMMACKKENSGAGPVITHVRNYAATPNDTLAQAVIPGQWVVLIGQHFEDVVAITFNGVAATFKGQMFSDTSAVVQVPAVIPFPTVPAEQLNVIQMVTTHGSTSFTFNIAAPPPAITGVSNENAQDGDSVYIYGTNLFFVQELSFAGVKLEKFAANTDGTAIGFIQPHLTAGGIVKVVTKSGADSTVYKVHDLTTGMLCDFDGVNPFSWGTNLESSGADFPGGHGSYAILKNEVLPGGDGTWWGNQRSINTNEVQWLPVDSLQAAVDGYAVKFEINVKGAWNGTSVYVIRNYDRAYLARYEPWLQADGATASYAANGWRTVTIPFTSFRTNDGKGTSAADLTAVAGSEAKGSIHIQTANFASSATPTGFYAAIDNIRIVKIK